MRVAVLAVPEDKEATLKILALFKELGIHASVYFGKAEWETADLANHIFKSTHFLFYCSAASIASAWFAFIAGFAIGREKKSAALLAREGISLPAYLLSAMPVSTDLETLRAYYTVEEGEWHVLAGKDEARHELLDLGISFKPEAFAESVTHGNLHAVELFLRAGLSPNTRDKHGVPMLCLAVRFEHHSILERLVEAGADIDLQSDDRGNSPVMDAAAMGKNDFLKLLIDRGAMLNQKSKDSQTALVLAVGRNDVEAVRLLTQAGADPDIEDKLGFSARKYATLFHNPEILPLIEAVGAKARS